MSKNKTVKIKHKGKVEEKPLPKDRSPLRQAANEKKTPPMKHKLQEKGGSNNNERKSILEYLSDKIDSFISESEKAKKPLSDEDGEEHEFDD